MSLSIKELSDSFLKSESIEDAKKYLSLGVDVNYTGGDNSRSLFIRSISQSNLVLAQFLLDQGVDINCKFKALNSLFYVKNLVSIEFLIDKGIDISVKDKYKNSITTCLLWSFNKDPVLESMLDVLIKSGARADKGIFCKASPVNYKITQMLIDAGADVNYVEKRNFHHKFGATPLILNVFPDVLQCLIDNGADLYWKTKDGHSILDRHYRFNNTEAIEKISEALSLKEKDVITKSLKDDNVISSKKSSRSKNKI